MQKTETGTIDVQQTAAAPKVAKLIEIAVDDQKKVYVNWPADKKELCIVALAEAIKLVETYQSSKVIVPERPKIVHGILDFIRGKKG